MTAVLIFFDETFRKSEKYPDVSLGALCGVGIDEKDMARVADDIYQLKYKHLGGGYAKESEMKGKELLKPWIFKLAKKNPSKSLALVSDILRYIEAKKLPIFGCVCFEKGLQKFQAEDVRALDKTFRFLFERVDMYMKIHRHHAMASLVFDDRDYGINQKNSEAITNFFQRSAYGLSMDSIIKTPFFAISQSQNVGLQLADLVTTVIGMRFQSNADIDPFYQQLKKSMVHWKAETGQWISSLKVLKQSGQRKSVG